MKNKLLALLLLASLGAVAQTKTMAITIDDLPAQMGGHDSVTLIELNARLLAHLTERKVPAIGFVNEQKLYRGSKIIDYRYDMLTAWIGSGLELGNHTYSHIDYNQLTPEQFFEIIEKGEPITKKLMADAGKPYRYFRHPYLHRGNTEEKVKALEEYLQAHGYTEAPVTIDNSEWIFASAFDKAFKASDKAMMDKIGATYISYMAEKVNYYEQQSLKLFGRPIAHTLLIHENLLNSYYLGALLDAYQGIGYSFVSLAEALKDDAYTTPDHFVGNAGISWMDRWAVTQGKKGDFFKGEPRCPQFVLDYSGLSE
ncbi:polysaccharide deacetylase family protein [uncultured Imperialibacter sp.]|mgnify:CR=1 FL=1|uniref:polysaccharide deacetylase family protein n=1 Tax=uncultured Imperialibacter sp. TaxID=1672639 RepID=UPI0030DCF8DF|tara:strand:- start:13679 stop:14614 length:936 start_codon:yes stop_codon:yes gene_type:complete